LSCHPCFHQSLIQQFLSAFRNITRSLSHFSPIITTTCRFFFFQLLFQLGPFSTDSAAQLFQYTLEIFFNVVQTSCGPASVACSVACTQSFSGGPCNSSNLFTKPKILILKLNLNQTSG
jgi:hypothetical protein